MVETLPVIKGPCSVGLPEPPGSEPLTKAQWHVLMAVMNTVITSCQKDEPLDLDTVALSNAEYDKTITHIRSTTPLAIRDTPTFEAFLAEKPSDIPLFRDILKRMLAGFPDDKLSALRSVLSLLE